jgi:uncharacterized protein YecE (DUF72 family)
VRPDEVGYRYGEDELAEWATQLRALAGQADRVHVLFNNCCAGNAQRDAARLTDLLAPPVPAPRSRRASRARPSA